MIRHHLKLAIEQKKTHEEKIIKTIEDKIGTKMDEQKSDMKCQMDNCYSKLMGVIEESEKKSYAEDEHIHQEIDVIKDGMLSIQGAAFKKECRKLLNSAKPISLNEYEQITEEHRVYNSLGGNHTGDALFKMLEEKYKKDFNASIGDNEGENL